MQKETERTPRQNLPGMIEKAASIAPHEVTEDELAVINKYALEPLTAEEIYVFKAVLCDNELDRQYERFTKNALQDLQKLFLGKTVIKDHFHSADNQVARIYATELVETGKKTKSGEPYTQLVAHCYMVRTPSNADLIAEIKGGIKREGSVGFSASSAICSICQTDNAKSYCRHYAGRTYEKAGGVKETCTFTLEGCSDAYEFSLVAVPAQKKAGVTKSYTGEVVDEKDFHEEEPTLHIEVEADTVELLKALEVGIHARIAELQAKHNTTPNDEI